MLYSVRLEIKRILYYIRRPIFWVRIGKWKTRCMFPCHQKYWHSCLEKCFLRSAVLNSCVMTAQCSSHKKSTNSGKITIQLAAMHTTITDKVVNDPNVHRLNQFTPTTEKELERIIRDCPAKTSSLDHWPTDVLKKKLRCQHSYLVNEMNRALGHLCAHIG